MPKLNREEYIEQAFLFGVWGERGAKNLPIQELLAHAREEILVTTNLPLAIDFMLAELNHAGTMSTAMRQLSHYFTSFQSYVIGEAEKERGRFDMRVAVEILRREADFRAKEPTPQAIFFYQLEAICRNRLEYDRGIQAIAGDPIFDEGWKKWIEGVRRQIGMIEIADMIYVCSEHYLQKQREQGFGEIETPEHILFGQREGRIALANRKREPNLLFDALQRQLGYPKVPRPVQRDETNELIPKMARQIEKLENRVKLLEEEQRETGIDLSKFYKPPE